jgi:hypothetical protein
VGVEGNQNPITDKELFARALAAAQRYYAHLDSPDKIARFAVWFLNQELPWHDVADDPPRSLPLLVWDTRRNIVQVGWSELSGWHIQGDEEPFTPHRWKRIHF